MNQMPEPKRFVGRGGLKLEAALEAFDIDVSGMMAADFGCNIGGFTDCLLKRGATKVFAIDTGYGMLDYQLRKDDRVIVMERTNVLHCDPPADGVDLVAIDAGWTTQAKVIPVARRWLAKNPRSCIISLVKPHYELSAREQNRSADRRGILDEEQSGKVLNETLRELAQIGHQAEQMIRSPLVGGKGKGRRGNIEFLALFQPYQNAQYV